MASRPDEIAARKRTLSRRTRLRNRPIIVVTIRRPIRAGCRRAGLRDSSRTMKIILEMIRRLESIGPRDQLGHEGELAYESRIKASMQARREDELTGNRSELFSYPRLDVSDNHDLFSSR